MQTSILGNSYRICVILSIGGKMDSLRIQRIENEIMNLTNMLAFVNNTGQEGDNIRKELSNKIRRRKRLLGILKRQKG